MSKNQHRQESIHRELTELLPWYVNGTLGLADAAKVAAHLASCAECRRELTTLQAISQAVEDSSAELPPAPANLYARTMDRIERFEAARGIQRTPAEALRRFFGRLKQAWFAVSLPARFAMGAQFVAIVLLMIGVVRFAQHSTRQQALIAQERQRAEQTASELNKQKELYQTLAADCPKARGEVVTIKVAFQESASAKSIRRVLGKVFATIVDGPSPQGFYVIAVPATLYGTDRQMTELRAIQEMLASKGVVQFAAELR